MRDDTKTRISPPAPREARTRGGTSVLRLPGLFGLAFPAPRRPFKWLGHAAELTLQPRYRQILAGQPSIKTYIQHVLFERGGVAADPDQQPLLGGLSDDGVKRAGSFRIAMVKCRRRRSVQYREHRFGAQFTRRPCLQWGQSLLRMRRATTMIQRSEQSGLKMIGARKPSTCAHCDGSRTGFDDRSNTGGIEKRIIILHGVRDLTEHRDGFLRRRTLIQDHPHDQVG